VVNFAAWAEPKWLSFFGDPQVASMPRVVLGIVDRLPTDHRLGAAAK
jgi:hypothetical protein